MARYHYILTMQRQHPSGGVEVATCAGPVDFTPGTTRAEAFGAAMKFLHESRAWRPEDGNVLFFSLESDELTA